MGQPLGPDRSSSSHLRASHLCGSIWDCLFVTITGTATEPDDATITRLTELGERIGLRYISIDDLTITYEIVSPISQDGPSRCFGSAPRCAASRCAALNFTDSTMTPMVPMKTCCCGVGGALWRDGVTQP
jgi:hypothetical protein